MNTIEFNKIVLDRLDLIEETLTKKALEYAVNDDRLHNFNKASQITGEIREKCLWGMAMKHLVSVTDIIDKMENSSLYLPSKELTSEKIGDLISYLILLEVSIVDKINNYEKLD